MCRIFHGLSKKSCSNKIPKLKPLKLVSGFLSFIALSVKKQQLFFFLLEPLLHIIPLSVSVEYESSHKPQSNKEEEESDNKLQRKGRDQRVSDVEHHITHEFYTIYGNDSGNQ